MGGGLVKNYDPSKREGFGGDPYLKWKCFPATHKERTWEHATIFAFEKTEIAGINDLDRKYLAEILRKDCLYLQKLRHPFILQVVESLLEDKNSMAFVTKEVSKTLAMLAESFNNSLPVASVSVVNNSYVDNMQLPLTMRAGILDVCEALSFLHNDAKLVHRNICPSSIFVTPSGKWCVGSMGCAQQKDTNSLEAALSFDRLRPISFHVNKDTSYSDLYYSTGPCYIYCAPELIAANPKVDFPVDVYSLGLVICYLLKAIKILSNAPSFEERNKYFLSQMRVNLTSEGPYVEQKRFYHGLHICNPLKELLNKILAYEPTDRPTIQEIIMHPYLNDVETKTLRYIGTLMEKDETQRSRFLSGFNKLLLEKSSEFVSDDELLRTRVMPVLLEMLENCSPAKITPFLLEDIFIILHKVQTSEYFEKDVWPRFHNLISANEIRIESVLLFLEELPFLISISTPAIIKIGLVPFLVKCLVVSEQNIQYKVIKSLGATSKYIDYIVLQNSVTPRLLHLLTEQQNSPKIKINLFKLLSQMAQTFDRPTISEKIVPAIEKASQIENQPRIILAAAETLNDLFDHLGTRLGGQRILPVIASFLTEDALARGDFNCILSYVNEEIEKICDSRYKEFEINENMSSKVVQKLGHNECVSDRPSVAPLVEQDIHSSPLSSFFGTIEAPKKPKMERGGGAARVSPVNYSKLESSKDSNQATSLTTNLSSVEALQNDEDLNLIFSSQVLDVNYSLTTENSSNLEHQEKARTLLQKLPQNNDSSLSEKLVKNKFPHSSPDRRRLSDPFKDLDRFL